MADYPNRDRLREEESFTDKAFPSPVRAAVLCLLLWLLAGGLAASEWAVIRAEQKSAEMNYEIASAQLDKVLLAKHIARERISGGEDFEVGPLGGLLIRSSAAISWSNTNSTIDEESDILIK